MAWILDFPTLALSGISSPTESVLGYRIGWWRSQPAFWQTVVHQNDLPELLAQCRAVAEHGAERVFPVCLCTADGEDQHYSIHLQRLDAPGDHVRLRASLFRAPPPMPVGPATSVGI